MPLDSLLWPSLTQKFKFNCLLARVLMTKCNLIITTEKMPNGSFFSKTFFFGDLIYKVSSCMNYIQCIQRTVIFQYFNGPLFMYCINPQKWHIVKLSRIYLIHVKALLFRTSEPKHLSSQKKKKPHSKFLLCTFTIM